MNKFDKNTQSDKSTALMLTILIHAAILGAMFFLSNPDSSNSINDSRKMEQPIVHTSIHPKA